MLDNEVIADLSVHSARIQASLALNAEERAEIERSTREQSGSCRWHAEHVGRITASIAHRVLKGA